MIHHYLLLSCALFAIGAFGVLARRNLLIVLMSARAHAQRRERGPGGVSHAIGGRRLRHGQVFVLLVMAVAAAEVAVGLAIVISLFRSKPDRRHAPLAERWAGDARPNLLFLIPLLPLLGFVGERAVRTRGSRHRPRSGSWASPWPVRSRSRCRCSRCSAPNEGHNAPCRRTVARGFSHRRARS
jgi:NADH-quinone oxidoreductase subunit K